MPRTKPEKDIANFKGIDLRRLQEVSDPRSCRRASNVDLTVGGEYTSRDGLRYLGALDPQSKGLYAINGTLRAAIPSGQGHPLDLVGAVRVHYDHIGAKSGTYASITATVTQGSDQIGCAGSVWPSWATAGTITILGVAYTVTGRSSDGKFLTISIPYASTALYSLPFSLVNGANSMVSRTASVANGGNTLVIAGGTLPADLRNTRITFVSSTFSSDINFRVDGTHATLNSANDGPALVDVPFTISGVASAYPDNQLVGVRSVESIGAQADFGAYPYLVIERWVDPNDHSKGTSFEHHWIRSDAVDPSSAQNSLVQLPFTPGPAAIKTSGKIFAIDDVNGVVRYCSTLNGPFDWTLAGDAGYIPAITHITGDRKLQGLGVYDDKLAIIFEDAVQLWITDPNPTNIGLSRTIVGPGTQAARSVANVVGDLFYFTAGGFRSLQTQTITNQIQERDDIGAKVLPLTETEDPSQARAIWSQRRGQYLCAFGKRVYAFRYNPKSGITGWTTWDLAVSIDYWCEKDGQLYVRSGDDLYVFDSAYDDGAEWDVIFNDFTTSNVSIHKWFQFIEIYQRGKSSLRIAYDLFGAENVADSHFSLSGTSVNADRLHVPGVSRSASVRFTGTGKWTLSQYSVQYTLAAW